MNLEKKFKNTKMIFVNIEWLKYYMGQDSTDKVPKNSGGGKEIQKYHSGNEDTLYYDIDGTVYGLAYPGGYTKYGSYHFKKLNLKGHFNDVLNDGDGDYVKDVLVVWVSNQNTLKEDGVIIGWWNNSILTREYSDISFYLKGNHYEKFYNIIASVDDCFLLEPNDRNYKVGKNRKNGVGFGQSLIWYADKKFEQDFKFKAYKYIKKCEENKNNLLVELHKPAKPKIKRIPTVKLLKPKKI